MLFDGVLPMLEELRARGHHWLGGRDRQVAARPGRGAAHRRSCEGVFDGSRTADETAGKPDPRMLHELMREFGVEPRAHADDRRHHARPADGGQRRLRMRSA